VATGILLTTKALAGNMLSFNGDNVNFQELYKFIDKDMKMSHVYQPVMLIELLKRNGRLPDAEIAKALLSNDQSQIDYYRAITNNMVGKVLRNRGVVSKESREYQLLDYDRLSDEEISRLIEKCKERLNKYIERKGADIFSHRRKSAGYISGTLRYEVFKRARFRCELCGISAYEKALEVDHINPRNKGGKDDISNFQALCCTCNAMKRDRDDADFRGMDESYKHREVSCIFCNMPKKRVIAENRLAFVVRDAYPVADGHSLIIPKRHIADYFSLGQAEINACTSLIKDSQKEIGSSFSGITGFNIGVNVGESAGQTIFHCHIHLIPRRIGDVRDPVGGVRNTIPGRGNYRKMG